MSLTDILKENLTAFSIALGIAIGEGKKAIKDFFEGDNHVIVMGPADKNQVTVIKKTNEGMTSYQLVIGDGKITTAYRGNKQRFEGDEGTISRIALNEGTVILAKEIPEGKGVEDALVMQAYLTARGRK